MTAQSPARALPGSVSPAVSRAAGLDRLRGLAVLCMVVDHVALFVAFDVARYTVGRLALPLFFVLGGALVTRLTWRHGWVALLGLGLPLVAGWIDSPNVLLLYAVGAALVVLARRLGPFGSLLGLLVMLTVQANGAGVVGTGYAPAALWALMFVGAWLPRELLLVLGGRLPGWLAVPGRYPLSIYVGHVLALTAVASLLA